MHKLFAIVLVCVVPACSRQLDAGSNRPAPDISSPPSPPPTSPSSSSQVDSGKLDVPMPDAAVAPSLPDAAVATKALLPVDARSPVVLLNDGPFDNWHGEYALTLAAAGRLQLAAIIVNNTSVYPMIETSVQGWREMVSAARSSGMKNLPDPIASITSPLVRPDDGDFMATPTNRSEGALLLVQLANQLGTTEVPLAVAVGGTLTDVADAFLIDPSIGERVIVVGNIGRIIDGEVNAGGPNGDIDSWATAIVTHSFRYIQVNSFYPQRDDITDERVSQLPQNAFGQWIAEKRPQILELLSACDQTTVMAIASPEYAARVNRLSAAPFLAGEKPTFTADNNGRTWHVSDANTDVARALFWESLIAETTYGLP